MMVSVNTSVPRVRAGTLKAMAEFDELRAEGWRRLLAAARRRLVKTGGEPTGSVALADPSQAERQVVDRITDRYRDAYPRRLVLRLGEIDTAVRGGFGVGLVRALAWLDGPDRRPGDLKSVLEGAMRCRHEGEGWYTGWLGALTRDGTANRLVRAGEGELLGWAAAVLDRLPARNVPLPVLAEWSTGDATALSGTPLADLVLRALVLWQGAAPPSRRADEHRIWNDAGVLVDDLTDQVLVLNLRVREDHVVAGWLADAASAGLPFRLTLHQLVTAPLTPDAAELFVCENPTVLRAAAADLGPGARPLVCTEGRVSSACHRLLSAATREGTPVRWHTDFDWPGLRTTAAATERYAATPWHMSVDDYLTSLTDRPLQPLEDTRAASPWDPALATAMTREARTSREEWLLPKLLTDLRPPD